MIPETENPHEAKNARISLRGMFRLIRVDTLRSVHTVGFLVERLICFEKFGRHKGRHAI